MRNNSTTSTPIVIPPLERQDLSESGATARGEVRYRSDGTLRSDARAFGLSAWSFRYAFQPHDAEDAIRRYVAHYAKGIVIHHGFPPVVEPPNLATGLVVVHFRGYRIGYGSGAAKSDAARIAGIVLGTGGRPEPEFDVGVGSYRGYNFHAFEIAWWLDSESKVIVNTVHDLSIIKEPEERIVDPTKYYRAFHEFQQVRMRLYYDGKLPYVQKSRPKRKGA